jgi:hypothetical protein
MQLKINKPSADITEKIDAFMTEFEEQTVPHPFMNFCRVLCGPNREMDGVVIEVSKSFGTINLGMIQALTTGIGEGSRGLRFLIALADKHDVSITGGVKRLGTAGLKTASLKAWYKRNGFAVSPVGDLLRRPFGANTATKKVKSLFSS